MLLVWSLELQPQDSLSALKIDLFLILVMEVGRTYLYFINPKSCLNKTEKACPKEQANCATCKGLCSEISIGIFTFHLTNHSNLIGECYPHIPLDLHWFGNCNLQGYLCHIISVLKFANFVSFPSRQAIHKWCFCVMYGFFNWWYIFQMPPARGHMSHLLCPVYQGTMSIVPW